MARPLLVLLLLGACGGDPAEKGGVTSDDTATADIPVETGGFTLGLQVVDPAGANRAGDGLCAAAIDLSSPAWGNPAPVRLVEGSLSAAGDGSLRIEEVPPAATLGIGLLIESCDGSDVVPTITPIPASAWAGAGPGDVVTGLRAFAYTVDEVMAIQVELEANGYAAADLATLGILTGTLTNDEGLALSECWVRGPAGNSSWYDQGGGLWEANTGTDADGGARYVVPGPSFGSFLGRGAGRDFAPFLGGGFAGHVERVDFTPIDPQTGG